MTTLTSAPQSVITRLIGPPRTPGDQDRQTVRLLRLGVGVIGTTLPLALIAGNWILGDKVIVPASMSGSYYTSTRNLFVGALCALGVFLIGYRHTERQNRCTWFAGLCALVVAFAPTAPPAPRTAPAWIGYLHLSSAGALIFTLGVFCWVVFTGYALPARSPSASAVQRFRAWLASLRNAFNAGPLCRLYFACGLLVFVSGALGVCTGVWPAEWSTGWSSLYLFEAIAVVAFGVAWITAGLTNNSQD